MKLIKKLLGITAIIAAVGFITLPITGCPAESDDGTKTDDNGGKPNSGSSAKTHITVATIEIDAPSKNATPATTIETEQERFTAGTVTWSPNDNPFKGETIYTATVTLTAKSGYTFTGLSEANAKINGDPAVLTNNTGETVTLSYIFPATLNKAVTKIEILTEPNKLTFTHGDTSDLTGLKVKLTFDDNSTDEVTAANFSNKSITTTPAQGIPLERSTYNNKQIIIRSGNEEEKTTGVLNISAKSITDLTFIPSEITPQTYTGSAITPTVKVTHTVSTGSTRELKVGTDYEVSYRDNIVGPTAAVIITGINDYTGTKELPFAITGVPPVGGAPVITTTSLPNGRGGRAYSQTLTATGDAPIRWSAVGLPVFLSLDETTGVISGTPYNYAGTVVWHEEEEIPRFTVIVTNDAGRDEKQLSIAFARVITDTGSGSLIDNMNRLPANDVNNPYPIAFDRNFTEFYVSSLQGRYVTVDFSENNFTSIPNNKFQNGDTIVSIALPSSVITIGNYAFQNCTRLTSINIPNNVITIGDYAFYNCSSLANISIPNNVTSIGSSAFQNCTSLTSITIPNNVSIGGTAFSSCTSLTSVTIGSGVNSIGSSAFSSCTSLIAINVDAGNSAYSSQDGVLYNKAKTNLITYPAGKASNPFIIPNSVTNIEQNAFRACINLTAINVDNSNNAYSSQDGVLYNKDKTNLITYPAGKTGNQFIIPNTVTSFGLAAFSSCTSLTSVTIPNSLDSIRNLTFEKCTSLTSVRFERANITFSTDVSTPFIDTANATSLQTAYTAGGIGTYTRPDTTSTTWTKISD